MSETNSIWSTGVWHHFCSFFNLNGIIVIYWGVNSIKHKFICHHIKILRFNQHWKYSLSSASALCVLATSNQRWPLNAVQSNRSSLWMLSGPFARQFYFRRVWEQMQFCNEWMNQNRIMAALIVAMPTSSAPPPPQIPPHPPQLNYPRPLSAPSWTRGSVYVAHISVQ